MSNDNDKKPSRGRGPKPAGARGSFGANKGGKYAGAKKAAASRSGATDGERPKRDFQGAGKSWAKKPQDGKGSHRSYGKEPRGGERISETREGRSFGKRDSERKSFRPRGDHAPDSDRPDRNFRGKDRSHGAASSEGGFRGDKKPFEKKRYDRSPRPGRFERAETRGDADNVRSERPQRPFREGPKPQARTFDKSADGERDTAAKGRYDRPKRDFADRPKRDFGDRPKRDFADRKPGGFKPRPRAADAPVESEGERIAKRLARAGIASRRDAEDLIAAGRIKVNGKVLTSPAFNVSPDDVIHLDGTEIPAAERTRLFLFHKPVGVVTTNRDPEGRKTVFDVLPADLPRLMTIGRLDINTEGLLLLTNDGGLSRVLELPATGWLRRYRARVHGKVEEKALTDLANGIAVGGVFYGAVEASLERTQGTNAWLTIGLREGKNREVKNILGALGLEVTRLIRVSYGPFQLGELPEGAVLEIKGRTLREQLGERLVEESGANFEAEIAKPFSNKPVRRSDARDEGAPRAKVARDGDRRPIGEGGLIKARKHRENSRDEALGKLSTRPERGRFGGKPAFGDKRDKKQAREPRPIEPPGQRRTNVWMAPGARPQAKAETSESPPSRTRGEGKGEGQRPNFKSKASAHDKKSREDSRRSALRAPSSRERGEGKPPKKR